MRRFALKKQLDQRDCGPACIRMVAESYGKSISAHQLRQRSGTDRTGSSLAGLVEAAESVGFRSLPAKLPLDKLLKEAPLPAILHWDQNHFVVLYKVRAKHIYIADPARGKRKLSHAEFMTHWGAKGEDGSHAGVVLLLEPSGDFYANEFEVEENSKGFRFFLRYLKRYRQLFVQLVLGLALGSLLQLAFPFLTQALVDIGIGNRDIGFIYLLLIGQVTLFLSRSVVEILRSWILLHISTRLNISIISDFLSKMMRLPISFFERRIIGDIIQRIGDHRRIESFMTNTTLSTLFAFVNLLTFSVVLLFYSRVIFLVFLVGSAIHIGWIVLFLKRRREIDHLTFTEESADQSKVIELITGMHEIKLNNIERLKRWEWEFIQARLFRVRMKGMALNLYQTVGAGLLNELKNIAITFIAATSVVNGEMTLGMMMAVSYIIGQLNSPISQFIGFVQAAQDAKISIERLREVHEIPDEEGPTDQLVDIIPSPADIRLDNVSFRYGGTDSPYALRNISVVIPQGKVTAIVGTSGSGKTTMLKLILKFFQTTEGKIDLQGIHLNNVQNSLWRDYCGVVMQEGFIFSDSIAQNISLETQPDHQRLMKAAETANLLDFIQGLPLGFQTVIGASGAGLSAGQKQRLLIARAVYKDPGLLIFDEATNALDARNESEIMNNLDRFLIDKTVIVVAHRLSTVKNADQILVLKDGELIESGNHLSLTASKGEYYELVRNQLELGK